MESAGERRHLLEEATFWSLQELADIARGSSSEIVKFLETAAPDVASLATAALLAPRPGT